jgi:formylglycine-generating enzyme required for sulfatase activity
MLLIPTGSFVMGFDDLEVARPQRRERIDAFYIDRLEVTNSEYRRFLEDLKHKGGRERYRHPGEPPNHSYWPVSWSDPRFAKEDLPVTGISWYAAYAFAKWLDKRLPTEKEWEKAARGSEGSLYPWGNEWLVDSVDAPAGSEIRKIRNDTSVYGIQDLAGSVQEWVADVDQDYLGQSVPRDSQGRSFSVLRGGFFLRRQPKDFVNFGRTFRHPESVYFYVGFRCAKDASESKQPPPADRFVGLVGLPSAAAGKQDFPGL